MSKIEAPTVNKQQQTAGIKDTETSESNAKKTE